MKHIFMLKVLGKDSWVRTGSDITGRPYATTSPWEGPLGPPSVFTDLDTVRAVASLVPGNPGLEPVLFVYLPSAPAIL